MALLVYKRSYIPRVTYKKLRVSVSMCNNEHECECVKLRGKGGRVPAKLKPRVELRSMSVSEGESTGGEL